MKRPAGFFTRMSKDELINWISLNCHGMNIEVFQRGARGAYDAAARLEIINELVESMILIKSNRRGFFQTMNDEEFLRYVHTNHLGQTITEFKKKDESCYKVAIRREIISRLVDDGVLIRERKPNGFFMNMKDGEFLLYVSENYRGRSIREFQDEDGGCYRVAYKRRLIPRLVEDGILIRKKYNNIPDIVRDQVILLFKESTLIYGEIALANGITRDSVVNILKDSIGEGTINIGYRRPNGILYLANVRRDSQKSLEDVLK